MILESPICHPLSPVCSRRQRVGGPTTSIHCLVLLLGPSMRPDRIFRLQPTKSFTWAAWANESETNGCGLGRQRVESDCCICHHFALPIWQIWTLFRAAGVFVLEARRDTWRPGWEMSVPCTRTVAISQIACRTCYAGRGVQH